MHNYHSANECLPAAYLPDRSGRPNDSWRLAILPYLEMGNAFNSINYAHAWDAPENATTRSTKIATFMRPGDIDPRPVTKFLVVVGPRTVFPGPVNRTFEQVRDGLSNTIAAGEVAESDIDWAEPRDLKFRAMDFRVNGPYRDIGFGSPFGGARVLLMDGSIKYLKNSVSPAVVRALITADGDEPIPSDIFD